MKHVRLPLALAAAAVLVLPATAVASKTGLELTEGESKTPATTALGGVLLDGCIVRGPAAISGNGTSKVKVSFSGPQELECGGEEASVEALKEFQLSTKGPVKGKGTLTIKEESGCAYEFDKFSGSLAIPGEVATELQAEGKLTKTSPKTCEKKVKRPMTFSLFSPTLGKHLNAELT